MPERYWDEIDDQIERDDEEIERLENIRHALGAERDFLEGRVAELEAENAELAAKVRGYRSNIIATGLVTLAAFAALLAH